MKRVHRQLALSLAVVLILIAGAIVVALCQAGGGVSESDQEAGSVGGESSADQTPGKGQKFRSKGHAGSADRTDRLPTKGNPTHIETAALERAAGKDPQKLKVVPMIPNSVRVKRGEALPCTTATEPINFQIFSAGEQVDGIRLDQFGRHCEQSTRADEVPTDFTSYVYGSCGIQEGQTGCRPPLEVQSFPACERSYADYSFEGKPLPYRELPSIDGAQVVEITFELDQRIEVYTGSTTIVIYATSPAIAEAALESLRSQSAGESPATQVGELAEIDPGALAPPTAGATEGELTCHS